MTEIVPDNNTAKQERETIAACNHCGSPVPNIGDEFCCRGCEFVYASIHALGLSSFYSLRNLQKRTADEKPETAKNYSYLNDPSLVAKIGERINDTRVRVSFYLPTMYCAACVWILERLPHAVPGIVQSRVSFVTGRIEVDVDTTVLSVEQVATILHSIGYPPVPAIDTEIAKSEQREKRIMLMRIGVSAVSAANTMMLADSLFQSFFTGMEENYRLLFTWASAAISLPTVTWAAFPFYRSALGSLMTGRPHMDLPISIAIILAYATDLSTAIHGGAHVYFDSITSLIFLVLTARYVQRQSIATSRATTATSWDLLPATVRVIKKEEIIEKGIQQLCVGERLLIRPEERIPCDGMIVKGSSTVNTSFLTGESLPEVVGEGQNVLGGSLNIDGTLEIEATQTGSEMRLGKVLESLSHSQARVAAVENRANVISGYFTLVVLGLSILAGSYWYFVDSERALPIVISLLVVTCPCALGLAIPAATSVALYQAQKRGLYVRNAETLHALARAKRFYFDKTGTLTSGELRVQQWSGEIADLSIVKALAIAGSRHPVSKELERYLEKTSPRSLEEVKHFPGQGVSGTIDGLSVSIGSYRWARERAVRIATDLLETIEAWMAQGMMVSVFAKNDQAAGAFAFFDECPESTHAIVKELNALGSVSILSGDAPRIVHHVAGALEIHAGNAFGDLSPEQKAQKIREGEGYSVFVGDGLNDALSLQTASVGVALRGGIEAAVEVAHVYVSKEGLQGFSTLRRGAVKLRGVVTRNLALSVAYNVVAATLAVTGHVTPLTAAILMPISSFVVILSSALPRYFKEAA